MQIAIVSTNKDKYSETFIKSHLRDLKGEIHYLFDGYLPKKYSLDKGITEFVFKTNPAFYLPNIFKKKKENASLLQGAIKKYLKKNKIQVVLAEYGPSGVEMMEICSALNIPLIVHFHGYDAYRDDVLGHYAIKYQQLFKHAQKIIAVSKDMCTQLKSLGCPSSKLIHIPYGIDNSLFNDHQVFNKLSNTFVTCGRFVAKKAPQITIKAFKIVQDVFPEARLIMIGNGALLKECKTLSKELGLQNNIQFTGALKQVEIVKIYRASFAFLQHSIRTTDNDSEGTPLSVLEAMGSGLPVIATAHAGINDVITHQLNGLLVQEMDIDDMAHQMKALLNQRVKAIQLGKQAAILVKEKYSLKSYIKKIQHVLETTTQYES
jgi:colanic acid/amylovoran biosynthesis glycosyltransferase